jgi:hypothetical protein
VCILAPIVEMSAGFCSSNRPGRYPRKGQARRVLMACSEELPGVR